MIGRFGVAKPTQKQFNFDIDDDEIPICMYGSMVSSSVTIDGQKRDMTLLEQLGFEITSDKNYGKDVVWFDLWDRGILYAWESRFFDYFIDL